MSRNPNTERTTTSDTPSPIPNAQRQAVEAGASLEATVDPTTGHVSYRKVHVPTPEEVLRSADARRQSAGRPKMQGEK